MDRLVHDYSLDITAAHDVLEATPSPAVLVAVDVPQHYSHWVPPGECDNRTGYFEVANSRVVYQQDGVTYSFGIASLISWRGTWYVVHLGAILRSTRQRCRGGPRGRHGILGAIIHLLSSATQGERPARALNRPTDSAMGRGTSVPRQPWPGIQSGSERATSHSGQLPDMTLTLTDLPVAALATSSS